MRRTLLIPLAVALAAPVVTPVPARAEEAAEKSADVEQAKKVAVEYLDTLVKGAAGKKPKPAEVSKKLASAKKFIHPKTMDLIKDQEKRKLVTVGVAVWHWAKNDYWLTEYEITEVRASGVNDTVVVEANEKNWRVEEGGEDSEPEQASYLLGKHEGKWYVVDKRRNGTFDKQAIRLGYKGYFDAEKKAEAAKPADEAAPAE